MKRDMVNLGVRSVRWGCGAGVALVLACAIAQPTDTAKPMPPAPTSPAKEGEKDAPPTETKESLPDLDALLKLAPPAERGGEKPAEQSAEKDAGGPVKQPSGDAAVEEPSDLEDLLSPAQTKNEFDQAIRLMGQTATRIEKAGDAGLATQRLQEDVLKRLDKLISSAEKQQQKQSSKSKPNPEQQKQQQQQQKNMAKQSQPQRAQDSSTTAEPPSREGDGAGLTPPTASAPAAWGELPAHVREALLQGSSDRFSSMYRTMTERYYQKLAEEPRK